MEELVQIKRTYPLPLVMTKETITLATEAKALLQRLCDLIVNPSPYVTEKENQSSAIFVEGHIDCCYKLGLIDFGQYEDYMDQIRPVLHAEV